MSHPTTTRVIPYKEFMVTCEKLVRPLLVPFAKLNCIKGEEVCGWSSNDGYTYGVMFEAYVKETAPDVFNRLKISTEVHEYSPYYNMFEDLIELLPSETDAGDDKDSPKHDNSAN